MQMTEVDNIIARARQKTKDYGEPLDNKHIAKHVRNEMDEYKDIYTGNMNQKNTVFSSRFLDFITDLAASVFVSFIVAVLAFLVFGTFINLFNLNADGATLVATGLAVLVGLLVLIKQIESKMTSAEQSAFSKGMDWQRDRELFEKALKKLNAE